MSTIAKDKLSSIINEHNKEIAEREATKTIEDNLAGYLKGQMTDGIKSVCDGYKDSFLSMAGRSFQDIDNSTKNSCSSSINREKNITYNTCANTTNNENRVLYQENTNDNIGKDYSTSTSNNNMSDENDGNDDEDNEIDEEHSEFDEEDDKHDEDDLNESELLFKTRSDDICIDEEGATTIDPSTQPRSDDVVAALKALYTMIIAKFDFCDRSMEGTKKKLRYVI